jgi:hypothetical protein
MIREPNLQRTHHPSVVTKPIQGNYKQSHSGEPVANLQMYHYLTAEQHGIAMWNHLFQLAPLAHAATVAAASRWDSTAETCQLCHASHINHSSYAAGL